jgi:hypothetical protein
MTLTRTIDATAQPQTFSFVEALRLDGRYRIAVAAEPGHSPGWIRVSRAVVEQICADHEKIRREYAERMLAGGYTSYGDALAETDAKYPRIALYGDHLVYDERLTFNDGDAIGCYDPDPDGHYTIYIGRMWYPIPADSAEVVFGNEGSEEPPVMRVLDLSTSHLPADLGSTGLSTSPHVLAYDLDSGWLMWVPSDLDGYLRDNPNARAEVVEVMRYAHKHDCRYVRFDADGITVEALPTWDW